MSIYNWINEKAKLFGDNALGNSIKNSFDFLMQSLPHIIMR